MAVRTAVAVKPSLLLKLSTPLEAAYPVLGVS